MAKYWLRWGYCYEQQVEAGDDLAGAIELCQSLRANGGKRRMYEQPAIFRPDNIDLDCANGLTAEEREQVEEAGL